MQYRNKTFVSFDGDTDMAYYRLMLAWAENRKISFDFHNAHDLSSSRDSSQEESIKYQLSMRMRNSKAFVLLVGERTRYLMKFVRWEIEQAVKRDLPMIVVNLNGRRSMDEERCPPIAKQALAVHVAFNARIVQYALDNWPQTHVAYRRRDRLGPFYYTGEIYRSLGL